MSVKVVKEVVVAKEVVKVSIYLKNKIIALWLHFWLKRIAAKYPDFFVQMIYDLGVPDKAVEVMMWRYMEKKKFKEIPKYIHTEERNVFHLHKSVIDKIINL